MSAHTRPRVLLADDHRVVAEGLRNLLSPQFDLVDVVKDGHALVAAAKTLRPDAVVTEITLPTLNGVEAMVQLQKDNPRVRVVFLTMHQDVAYARRALKLGASGFVLKHSAPIELVSALHAALSGKTFVTPTLAGDMFRTHRSGQPDLACDPVASLTPRQREVMQFLAEGHSAKQVGALLGISARTVEFHKYQMMETLHLPNFAKLVHFAIRHGIVGI